MYACITKNGSFECTQMFLASPQLSFEMDPIHLGHPVFFPIKKGIKLGYLPYINFGMLYWQASTYYLFSTIFNWFRSRLMSLEMKFNMQVLLEYFIE